jgi:FtsZ-binding cell division protein ZapB
MQTEVELLKEENAKLRRGQNAKTRNTEEVFFSAQDSKSPSLSNYSSNPRLATKVGKSIQKRLAPST